MNKKESRYFCTAEKMDRALVELLEKKDFEYITVKEICERAGVNRSTFYLHYENTADLLREATRHVVDGFLTYFESIDKRQTLDIASCDRRELIFMREEYVMPYLTYIKDNARVFKTALQKLDTMGLESYYARMFRELFDPLLTRFHVPTAHRPYVMKFYLTGVTAIAMEWLRGGCREPIETVCQIIIDCTTHGYESITEV